MAAALADATDRSEAAARWREFDARFAEARRTFVVAGRSSDIKPSEDL